MIKGQLEVVLVRSDSAGWNIFPYVPHASTLTRVAMPCIWFRRRSLARSNGGTRLAIPQLLQNSAERLRMKS